jgi:hypothetical protein
MEKRIGAHQENPLTIVYGAKNLAHYHPITSQITTTSSKKDYNKW